MSPSPTPPNINWLFLMELCGLLFYIIQVKVGRGDNFFNSVWNTYRKRKCQDLKNSYPINIILFLYRHEKLKFSEVINNFSLNYDRTLCCGRCTVQMFPMSHKQVSLQITLSMSFHWTKWAWKLRFFIAVVSSVIV